MGERYPFMPINSTYRISDGTSKDANRGCPKSKQSASRKDVGKVYFSGSLAIYLINAQVGLSGSENGKIIEQYNV
jgi:hypothetical protein